MLRSCRSANIALVGTGLDGKFVSLEDGIPSKLATQKTFIATNVTNATETPQTRSGWSKFKSTIKAAGRAVLSALCCCYKEPQPEPQEFLDELIKLAHKSEFYSSEGVFRLTTSDSKIKKAIQDPRKFLKKVQQGESCPAFHASVIKYLVREICLTDADRKYLLTLTNLTDEQIKGVQTKEQEVNIAPQIPVVSLDKFPATLQSLFQLFIGVAAGQSHLEEKNRTTIRSLAASFAGSCTPALSDTLLFLGASKVIPILMRKAIEQAALAPMA